MMRRLALLLPLAFAACIEAETPPHTGATEAPLPAESACGAPELQGLVGRPTSVLETMKFGTTVRITRPGTAVTMDYLPARLNIDINEAEVIVRVSCG